MGFLGNVLSCIVAVTVFYHILEIEATKPCCDCTFNAPNVTSADLQKTYRDLVKQIWCRKEFMDTLSPLGLKFRTKILELVEDLGSPASGHAILMSYTFLTIAPFNTGNPPRCSMSKAINNTILYLKGDKKIINDTLTIYALRKKESNILRAAIKRMAAGCDGYSCDDPSPYPTMPPATCYNGGFSYDIRYLWDRPEVCNSRIKELKQLVLEMYKSCNYSDNFIAMLATYPLLPSYRRIFTETNPNIIIESMNLQMSPPIQQCCCYQRIKRIDDLDAMYANEIDLQVANEKKRILSYKKCQ